MSPREILRATHLSKVWPGKRGAEPVHAVVDISLSLQESRTVCLLGESGSGKTTTGSMLVGLVEPTAGTVVFEGANLTALRGRALRRARRGIQMVFQNPRGSLNPRLSIGASIAEPLKINGSYRELGESYVHELLSSVGLAAEYARARPGELSGGQLQRVVIARALSLRPKVLVLDEPVSALDMSVQAGVLNLLKDLQTDHGLSFLLITHDVSVARYMADDVVIMRGGQVLEAGAIDLLDAPQHEYTRELLSAVPSFARVSDPRSTCASGETGDRVAQRG
jgi:ABC-type glutathione transport system ATPase component